MLAHEGELSAGLLAWIRGDDGFDAEAAGLIVGETLLMWRALMKSKFK